MAASGRSYYRIARSRDTKVVAVNDLTDTATLAHLLAYDSTFGRLDAPVVSEPGAIVVDGQRVVVTAEKNPAALGLGGARKCSSRRPASRSTP